MSQSEVNALLDHSKTLIVGTVNKDGTPHLTALWFARHGDVLLFETYGASQKVVNLRRDPRITVLCEAGESYYELRGVSIAGIADIIAEGPRLREFMTIVVKRNVPGIDESSLQEHVTAMMRKRVVVKVEPTRTISWDHRKLGAD